MERAGIEPTNGSRRAGLGVQCPPNWAASPHFFEGESRTNGWKKSAGFGQLGERHFGSAEQPLQSYLKKPAILAVIVAVGDFLKVRGQVLATHLVVATDDAALQKAPSTFHCVRVDFSADPRFRMPDPTMLDGKLLRYFLVSGKLIGIECKGFRRDVLLNQLQDRIPSYIAHGGKAHPSTTLDHADNGDLAASTAPRRASLAPTKIGFVNLYFAGELLAVAVAVRHCCPNPVAEIPRGLVTDSQGALELERRNAFLRLTHQVHSHKPLTQWQVRVVEDGASGNAELPIAVVADELPPRLDAVALLRLAMRAGGAIGPAQRDKVVMAPVVAPEFLNHIEKVGIHSAIS